MSFLCKQWLRRSHKWVWLTFSGFLTTAAGIFRLHPSVKIIQWALGWSTFQRNLSGVFGNRNSSKLNYPLGRFAQLAYNELTKGIVWIGWIPNFLTECNYYYRSYFLWDSNSQSAPPLIWAEILQWKGYCWSLRTVKLAANPVIDTADLKVVTSKGLTPHWAEIRRESKVSAQAGM